MYILIVSRGAPSEKYPENGIFEYDQAKALAALGHKVVFAAVDIRSVRRWRRWGIQHRTADGMEIYEINVPVGAVPPVWQDRVGKWSFHKLYSFLLRREGRPDIIHAHFGDVASFVTEQCAEQNLPYVVTEHSSLINRDAADEAMLRLCRPAYKQAAAVVAVSGAMARRLRQYAGADACVIANVVDLALFSPVRKTAEGRFRVISAGHLIRGKGFDVLLRAFARFAAGGRDSELLIMGGGEEENALRLLTTELGIEDKVTFYGSYRREEMARELAKSDCFALASRGETFGVVYAEALAAGLPVIATRCGGPEDFVNETNGLLVPVDDEAALAEAMEYMYEHRKDYDAASIAEDIRLLVSPKTVAERLTALYEKVGETQCNNF